MAGIIIGSEPVTESAVDSFLGAFSVDRSVLRPSYGLAEAALIVSTPQTEKRPVISHFNRAELAAGRAVVEDKTGPNKELVARNFCICRVFTQGSHKERGHTGNHGSIHYLKVMN